VRIAEQRKAEAVLVAELAVRCDRVLADAEHHRAELLELGQRRIEVVGLDGTARRVVARIEVQDHDLARVVGELHLAAVGRFERDRRRPRASFEHAAAYHVCYDSGMRVARLVIALAACSSPAAAGPHWPRPAPREVDGGESLAPRAAARSVAARSEDR